MWNLFAYGEQIMRAADCKNWRKSPKGFFDKLNTPGRLKRPGVFFAFAYRYLAVETLTPGAMVEATVQDRIY